MSTKTGSVKRAPETRAPLEATRPPRKKERSRRSLPKAERHARRVALPNLAAPRSITEDPRHHLKRGLVLALSILLMGTGLGLLVYPFIPMIRYAVVKPAPAATYETALTELPANATVVTDEGETLTVAPVEKPRTGSVRPKPPANRFVIPKIGVDVAIVEGSQDDALNRGIWHIPGTSSPDKGSNMVLSGHRFRFLSGPRTLYLLDRMEKGDPMIVYWQGKEYDYVVTGKRIVRPNQVEILDATDKPRLTVFTCSPLFSTKERLVLIAKPL